MIIDKGSVPMRADDSIDERVQNTVNRKTVEYKTFLNISIIVNNKIRFFYF